MICEPPRITTAAGISPSPAGSYSFSVLAGATFVVMVQENTANQGCANYTLQVLLSCDAWPPGISTRINWSVGRKTV